MYWGRSREPSSPPHNFVPQCFSSAVLCDASIIGWPSPAQLCLDPSLYFPTKFDNGRNYVNAGVHRSRASKPENIVPYISGPSERNLFHVTLLAHRILRWLLDFWKICWRLCKHITEKVNVNGVSVKRDAELEVEISDEHLSHKWRYKSLKGSVRTAQ